MTMLVQLPKNHNHRSHLVQIYRQTRDGGTPSLYARYQQAVQMNHGATKRYPVLLVFRTADIDQVDFGLCIVYDMPGNSPTDFAPGGGKAGGVGGARSFIFTIDRETHQVTKYTPLEPHFLDGGLFLRMTPKNVGPGMQMYRGPLYYMPVGRVNQNAPVLSISTRTDNVYTAFPGTWNGIHPVQNVEVRLSQQLCLR